MRVAFLTHPECALHDAGFGHPESPARFQAILDLLPTTRIWKNLVRYEAEKTDWIRLYRVHDRELVDSVIAAAPARGRVFIDPDTSMGPDSLDAALRAAGSVVQAVDLVMAGTVDRAFCCVRPPGHHAETRRSMGFCLFNNIAVGVRYAQDTYALKKIAIVDFDVHHGNGTEDIFCEDPSVLFCSTFQHPLYPGMGLRTKSDHIVNVPLPAMTEGPGFRAAFEDKVLPALNAFGPELVFISAGFDAHKADPLAQLLLTEDDFAWVTAKVASVADVHAKGRIVSSLEGGYDLDALPRSVEAHLSALIFTAPT